MARKKTLAASQPKAKAVRRELSLGLPIATRPAQATPAKTPASATAPAPAVSVAKVVPAPPTPVKAVEKPADKPAAQTAAMPLGPVPTAAQADLATAGQDMIKTYEACGAIAAKGVENLGKEVVSFARGSVQAQLDLTEALVRARTLQEAFEAHRAFTRESFDNMATEFAKLTGMSMELTQELMAPIQTRATKTARSLWRPLAA